MPDVNPTLSLREIVYHDMKPFYVVAHKIVSSTLANKVMYQIAQDMPNMYGDRRGPWPSITAYFDREDLMNQAEYDVARLASIESIANEYERTFTGIPILRTNTGVGEAYKFVFDGTESFEWDGEAYPPYEHPIALGTSWFDWIGTPIIATLTDIEDGGGSNPIVEINHVGNVNWDGTNLVIDNAEFTLLPSIHFTDPDDVTSIVTDVDLSVLGTYTISMTVVDNQRIYSYPLVITVEVHEVPVPPPTNC